MNKTKIVTEFVTSAFAAGKIDAQTMQSLMEHHMETNGIHTSETVGEADNVSFSTTSERTLKLVVNN